MTSWRRMAIVVFACFLYALLLEFCGPRPQAAAACQLQILTPSAMAPMRYVKLRTIVEPSEKNRGAYVALYGPDGEKETGSGLLTDSRTKQVEWKNLTLLPGDYVVRLTVDDEIGKVRCSAEGRLVVAGSID